MPTDARSSFLLGLTQALRLSQSVSRSRISISDKQVFYHADLAATVAAWDNYINVVIVEFVSKIGDYSDADLDQARQLLDSGVKSRLEKFNTPNYENCQRLFAETIGLDIIPHWTWPRRGKSANDVKERLNQILKIRHSFAHGFSMPSYDWLPQSKGNVHLNMSALDAVHELLEYIVMRTDKALDDHMKFSFRKNSWRFSN